MDKVNVCIRISEKLARNVAVLLLFVLCACVTVACDKDDDFEEVAARLRSVNTDFSHYAFLYPQADYHATVEACSGLSLQGKSIAYIGGSIASRPESDMVKSLVYGCLGKPKIYTYGRGGHGFATSPFSFQTQVEACKVHDIYILWCSTNDFYTGVPQGTVTDYTEEDGWDEEKRITQCGGMNYCIRHLRQLNPDALIIGFTSLPFFGPNGESTEGYTQTSPRINGEGMNFYQYIQVQQQVFERNGVPFLNQWDLNLFSVDTYPPFYKDDGVHFSEDGYFVVGCKQLMFIAEILRTLGYH